MKGMQALQKTADLTYNNEIPTSVYNPSGMYGLKAMGSYVPEYPQLVTPRPILSRRLALPVVKEKKMVKLAPLRMNPHLLLRLLHADDLAVLAGDGGGHLSAVRRGLVKLLPQLEFQFHGLECGGGLDGPDPAVLGDLADRGGDGGRLPQQEVHVQLLQHLLVLVGGGPLVLPLEGLHGGGELYALT